MGITYWWLRLAATGRVRRRFHPSAGRHRRGRTDTLPDRSGEVPAPMGSSSPAISYAMDLKILPRSIFPFNGRCRNLAYCEYRNR